MKALNVHSAWISGELRSLAASYHAHQVETRNRAEQRTRSSFAINSQSKSGYRGIN
jgi:hypothetical protein